MAKMVIHSALAELKLLYNKILKQTMNLHVAGIKGASDKFIYSSTLTADEFVKKADADIQSIGDLYKRRTDIKRAIVKSNALTEVKIGDKTMTVADAIEMKNSIVALSDLLNKLKYEKADTIKNFNKKEEQLEFSIQEQIKNSGLTSADAISNFSANYKKENEYTIYQAKDLDKIIEKLEDYVDTFTSEVDAALSISNATTTIDV